MGINDDLNRLASLICTTLFKSGHTPQKFLANLTLLVWYDGQKKKIWECELLTDPVLNLANCSQTHQGCLLNILNSLIIRDLKSE